MEMLLNGAEGGHKILLFSQFTSMLDILGKRLKKEGLSYYLLTGATPKEERLTMVNAFQKDQTPIFLISLKAGGTGLNLTAADVVIHYDPWWNVAAQNQATDRAHRIGQDKQVSVFKLITRDTIEENILKLQEGQETSGRADYYRRNDFSGKPFQRGFCWKCYHKRNKERFYMKRIMSIAVSVILSCQLFLMTAYAKPDWRQTLVLWQRQGL